MTEPFTYAAHLDAAPEAPTPPVSSPNRAYGWFPPPRSDQVQVLFVGDPQRLLPWLGETTAVDRVDAEPPAAHVDLVPPRPTIWLLRDQRAPWTTVWRAIRKLAVIPPEPD